MKKLKLYIFVRYDSVNLNDYRQNSRFWRTYGLNRIRLDIKDLQWARGVLVDQRVLVGIRTCQWAQGRVSGHKDVSVGTGACQLALGRASGHKDVTTCTRACQRKNLNIPVVT